MTVVLMIHSNVLLSFDVFQASLSLRSILFQPAVSSKGTSFFGFEDMASDVGVVKVAVTSAIKVSNMIFFMEPDYMERSLKDK